MSSIYRLRCMPATTVNYRSIIAMPRLIYLDGSGFPTISLIDLYTVDWSTNRHFPYAVFVHGSFYWQIEWGRNETIINKIPWKCQFSFLKNHFNVNNCRQNRFRWSLIWSNIHSSTAFASTKNLQLDEIDGTSCMKFINFSVHLLSHVNVKHVSMVLFRKRAIQHLFHVHWCACYLRKY